MKFDYRTILILLLILALQIVLRIPFLQEPLERDEGAYAYIAQRMLAGELPYRDYFDHKPPAIYFIYAGMFKLFGDSQASIRIFTLVFSLVATLSVFMLGYLLWGGIGGLLSTLIYALFSGGPYIQGTSANTETFMVLPMVLALSCFLVSIRKNVQREWIWLFLAGLFSGLAIMIKQVAVLNFLVLFGFVLYGAVKPYGKFQSAVVRKFLCLILGFMIFPLFFILYFWSKGAFLDFVNVSIFENLVYVRCQTWAWMHLLRVILLENSVLWVLAFSSAGYIFFKERDTKHLLLVIWTLFSVCSVFAGKAFYGHYFIQVIPGLSLLSAYGILKYTEKPRNILLGLGIGILLFFLLGFALVDQVQFYFLSTKEISIKKYPSAKFGEALELANLLKPETVPQDTIFVWGAEPEIYFYTRTRCASRYIYYYPLIFEAPGVLERRKELLLELEKNKPKFIICVSRQILNDPLCSFIRKNYQLYFVKNSWAVFKRNE